MPDDGGGGELYPGQPGFTPSGLSGHFPIKGKDGGAR